MSVLILCCILLCLLQSAEYSSGANILITIDLPSPSHQIWHYALAEGLMEKGHNVTLVGPFSDMNRKSEKYHPIVVEGVLDILAGNPEYDLEESVSKKSTLQLLGTFADYSYVVCKHSYSTKGFTSLLNYPPDFKFDLIITDMTLSSCFYPLIQKFNYPPSIATTAFLLPSYISATFGNGFHSSFLPFLYSPYDEDMSFFERVANYLFVRLDYFLERNYEMYHLGELARNTFGDNVESMQALERRFSLLLCNLNAAFNFHLPQPVTPNIIPVGGLHIKASPQLPMDIQRIMDNAKHGVILFSLGTNIQSTKLKFKQREALLNGFSQLKQTVIWKFEGSLENAPKNVIIRKWVPQNSILAHPNLRLFITHGGALSTEEASYFGIPMIGVPFFIDQRINVQTLVQKKMGLKMDIDTLTSQTVFDNVNEVLENPIYSKNMRQVSIRIREQQNTPLETAIFWSEFVMRHNGADFLSPKSRDLPFFVETCLDVELFLITSIVLFILLLFCIFKSIKALFTSTRCKRKQKVQ